MTPRISIDTSRGEYCGTGSTIGFGSRMMLTDGKQTAETGKRDYEARGIAHEYNNSSKGDR